MRKPIGALIGADGQLGTDLQKYLPMHFELVCLTIKDIDITQFDSIDACLSQCNPDIVLSTAGFHDVPFCEEDPVNSFLVNTVGTKYLTDWCFYNQSKLVFISTDYVFNGEKNSPYVEDDVPDPINTYGISKYAGELYIKHHLENHAIIRTTGLYGDNACLGKPVANFYRMFVNLIKNKDVVEFDGKEICSPTNTLDLSKQIDTMLLHDVKGTFHAVNDGYCSWFEFGQAIIEELGASTTLQFVERPNPPAMKELEYQPINRPHFTALENKHLKELGIYQMSHWRDALHEFVKKNSE